MQQLRVGREEVVLGTFQFGYIVDVSENHGLSINVDHFARKMTLAQIALLRRQVSEYVYGFAALLDCRSETCTIVDLGPQFGFQGRPTQHLLTVVGKRSAPSLVNIANLVVAGAGDRDGSWARAECCFEASGCCSERRFSIFRFTHVD